MSISGEVAASIENSASAADSNGDRRSAPLTRATRIIPASRAATTAWWTLQRCNRVRHPLPSARQPGVHAACPRECRTVFVLDGSADFGLRYRFDAC
jgi:hypothetical protein